MEFFFSQRWPFDRTPVNYLANDWKTFSVYFYFFFSVANRIIRVSSTSKTRWTIAATATDIRLVLRGHDNNHYDAVTDTDGQQKLNDRQPNMHHNFTASSLVRPTCYCRCGVLPLVQYSSTPLPILLIILLFFTQINVSKTMCSSTPDDRDGR